MAIDRVTVADGIGCIDHVSGSTLDYPFNCTAWLAQVADKIISVSITVDAESGLSITSSTFNDNYGVAWVSGGTKGKKGSVKCKITTNSVPARVETFTLVVNII